MKKLLVVAVPIAALFFAGAWAQEVDPSRQISEEWAAQQELRAERQERLDDLMMTMATEMAEIRATTNRAERESLMKVHRENMREAMGLMRSMGGLHMQTVMSQHLGSGMKAGMGSNMSQHAHKNKSASRPHQEMSCEDRISDLENRMDMMHVMMESMVEADANH